MRSKKALYNIIARMAYEIVTMACGLILPRYILSAFGSSYNGMISSITQFLSYISILTLGIGGPTRVAIYNAYATGGIKEVSAVLKATENYMRKVALAFIGYMAILAIVYPQIVKGEFAWLDSASLVVIIGLGTFAEYFFGVTNSTFLAAKQSSYIYYFLQIGLKIANTIISVALITAGFSIQIVKLGSAVCFVATPIILDRIVRRKYGIIKDVEPDTSALKQRGDAVAHSIANTVHDRVDIFLLTLFTAPAVVSVYSVYMLVVNAMQRAQQVFTTGLEGAFGELWAGKQKKLFEKNFKTYEFLTFSFVSIVFTCGVLLLLPFIALYTKGITDVEYIVPSFAILALAAAGTFCIRGPYVTAVQAAGRYKQTKAGAILEAALNLGLSLLGVFRFGLIGVTFGTIAANTFRTVQYAFYAYHHLVSLSMRGFLKRCAWLALTMTVSICIGVFAPTPDINSWLIWILMGAVYLAVSVSITAVSAFVFYRGDLMNCVEVARRMLKK